VKGNLSVGQTYVLRVTAYNGNVTLNWDANLTSSRLGPATWAPITDIDGNKLTTADPFQFNASISTGGRAAGDEVFGTLYGRPEDIVISTDCQGREVLYFAATSENAVYTVVLLSNLTAEVKVFCDRNTIDIAC
jgi:secreted PhoX family phosphatase